MKNAKAEYDAGWQAWLDGAEGPSGDCSDDWWQGFRECAGEYPRDSE